MWRVAAWQVSSVACRFIWEPIETSGIETGFREDMSERLISFLVVLPDRRKKAQGGAQGFMYINIYIYRLYIIYIY